MATTWKDADVRCPFYRFNDGKRRISCEGIVDDSGTDFVAYRKAVFETQITNFCCRHYQCCELYRMLMAAKYDEEE